MKIAALSIAIVMSLPLGAVAQSAVVTTNKQTSDYKRSGPAPTVVRHVAHPVKHRVRHPVRHRAPVVEKTIDRTRTPDGAAVTTTTTVRR